MNMKPETANAIYDVLVEECKAIEDHRDGFVAHIVDSLNTRGEWRFSGCLGFGGKFWWNSIGGPFYVNCYSEDRTKKRDVVIRRTNERLVGLKGNRTINQQVRKETKELFAD